MQVFRPCFEWIEKHSGTMTALATVAIAVLTFYYVDYSKKQWQTLREQVLSHRPWVNVRVSVERPIVLSADGANLVTAITIKNGGSAPALSIEVRSMLFIGVAVPDSI